LTVDLFTRGYPNLAAFQDSSENFMLYRRFGYLQARILLDKQDELRRLEEELDTYDSNHPLLLTTRSLTDEEAAPRNELLTKIEQALGAYGRWRASRRGVFADQRPANCLFAAQKLMEFRRPNESEYTSVHNYLDNKKPIHQKERSYISHKDDLITLRAGREHAYLDRVIEYMLRKLQKPMPWFTVRLIYQAVR
jgi:hypothetical protein